MPFELITDSAFNRNETAMPSAIRIETNLTVTRDVRGKNRISK